ncbi:amino acid adenylation domain-containing protein [Tumebacillus sp. BK434]|uniref:non-ribosomal peptide synthetase n=1 Tax=Tumebacillus sp. BK434 TaxID=2512169 RepID=UPI00104DFC13|nr:non-ribosomal peptide synthetase [Tumebacillus sp. BK434]TCP59043.1 amino acid adenylation domain-containing protein [Tumebacillus sp. BK434]
MADTTTMFHTLTDLLRWRAVEQPAQLAYTFLLEDGEEVAYTYQDVDRKARALGAALQGMGAAGERALLLYQPGMDYLVAFFGCLYAGVQAVPAYPPRQNGNLDRLQAVVTDAQARFALTTSGILPGIAKRFADTPGLSQLKWVETDTLSGDLASNWTEPVIGKDSLAFLQYTSGSTSAPKGVMLSHGNLLHNLALIHERFGITNETEGVVWLPPYHDMGLIGGILQPLFGGYHMSLMAPVSFITKPLRWLEAISRKGATLGGGPNFAYELCVQKITPEQRDALDLSKWENAFTGAEPVRHETLQKFAEYFAPAGFRREAFYPCYGLAEGTLFVSGGEKQELPIVRDFDGEALEQNKVVPLTKADDTTRTLVSSGRIGLCGQDIAIVNTVTLERAAAHEVGEIWVSGPSVAQGYWNRPEQTEETFGACLGDGAGPFLRTGDLGFVQDGELYVTGRLKDLIIIRGRNHYPQDIEFTVGECHPAVAAGVGAAVAVEIEGEERLVIVQEIERAHRKSNLEEVTTAIRQAVAKHHELQVYAVVLIKPASIPKTSSGKIQRHLCKERFLQGGLDALLHSSLDGTEAAADSNGSQAAEELNGAQLLSLPASDRRATLEAYLLEKAAGVLKIAARQLSNDQSLNALGLDSLMAVELKNEVEESFGVALPLARLLDGPSVAALAEAVLDQIEGGQLEQNAPAADSHDSNQLSYGQRALWFMQRLAPESSAYNVSRAVRLPGELDVAALKRSFELLLRRHPQLRMNFVMQDGEPVQKAQEYNVAYFVVEDARALSEAELTARLAAYAHRPFDLEQDSLLRVYLLQRSEQEHILLLVMHHIIVDFWSLAVLVKELRELYPLLKRGEIVAADAELAPDHYRGYAARQAAMLESAKGDALLSYWKQQLGGTLPVLNLPTDRPRPPVQTYHGAAHGFRIAADVTQKLKELAQANGATLYMALLAAYQVLLHRYSGQDDILVGSPTAGRSSAKDAQTVGYFVNPVVLRGDLSDRPSFVAFLQQMRSTVLAALDHQEYPLPLLVEKLAPKRDLSYPPLFQAMFVLQKSHLESDGLTALAVQDAGVRLDGGLAMEGYALPQQMAQFDLTLTMTEHDGELLASFEYNTDLFDTGTIERMSGHLARLLGGLADAPEQSISELPMLTPAEREQVLYGWNDFHADFSSAWTVHQRFEQQAERTPHAVAVTFEGRSMTYAELNVRANQLAHRLGAYGVGPEVMVGLCVERSLETVVGVLGILKAGGAYVPLDPTYPQERIAFVLADAKVPVLLTQQKYLSSLSEQTVPVIALDSEWETIAAESTANPDSGAAADSLAYVIYTSGSTGLPKGVLIEHRNVVRLLDATEHWFHFDERDVWTLFHSYAFDFSVWELWGALLYGGKLVVVPYGVSRDPQAFYELLVQERVTVLNQTPSAFRQLLAAEEARGASADLTLRYVIFGGEALDLPSLKPWYQRHGEQTVLVNMYGITETTVHVTYRALTQQDVETASGSVIGGPIPDLQVYLLDGQGQPVPVGVPGEMYVGGAGLARGYLNRDELTAERFLPNPFGPGRLYKSGDLARFQPDGQLQYLGRIDHQVKVRGFRIELGEIEAALEQHPVIREALVLAREDEPGEKRLVAYFTARETLTGGDLRAHLKDRLPEYMVPSAFLQLDAFPLTGNGKIDRRALPAPETGRRDVSTQYAAPKNELQRQLAEVWQEALGMEQVGIYDNFFDLGGHSLSLAKAHHLIQEKLLRKFSIVEMFKHPTIEALAGFLHGEADEAEPQQKVEQLRDKANRKKEALNRQKQFRKDRRK